MRKTWLLIGLIMIIFTAYVITSSYAKYTTEAEGTAEKDAGAWAVSINSTDVVTGNGPHTFNISNITFLPNPYIETGFMGPSSVGYFEIVIDPSGSDTAVRYDISIDSTDFVINDSIRIDSVCTIENGVEDDTEIVQTTADTYTGVFTLAEVNNGDTKTARVYIIWEEEGENDIGDTVVGDGRDIQLDLPISVVVSQYMGETITAYQPNNGGT